LFVFVFVCLFVDDFTAHWSSSVSTAESPWQNDFGWYTLTIINPVNQPINQSIKQAINQSISQAILINQSIDRPTKPTANGNTVALLLHCR